MDQLKGTISQRKRRDGSVAYRVQMPPTIDPLTGGTVRPGETFDTEDEAIAWRLEQNTRLHSARPPSRITLRQVYVRKMDRSGLKQSTKANMAATLRRLPDKLLDTEIRHITPEAISEWVTGDLVKREYKLRTMISTMAHLSSVFTWARDSNIETRGNPAKSSGGARLIRLYAPEEGADDYDEWCAHQFGHGPVWTPEQIRSYILSQAVYPYRALVTFIALQATRRGEALGLRWRRLDAGKGLVRVQDNVTWGGATVVEGTPKSGSGRWVVLDPMVLETLLRHQETQEADKSQYPDWDGAGWVFTRRKHGSSPDWSPGTHMVPTTISNHIRSASKRLGFPVIGPHGLRRSWATIAEDIGIPRKVRRDVLGHSGDSMTDRYSRSSFEEIREGLAKVRQKIFPDWADQT